MQNIGQQIRKIRKQQKMNINQLGKMVGVSGSYIAKLETGERRFSLDLLSKIARELGVPLAGLVGSGANAETKIPVYRSTTLPENGEISAPSTMSEFQLDVPSMNAEDSFAMIADAPSTNGHHYKAGDLLIFKRDTRFVPGDCVLFQSNGSVKIAEYQQIHQTSSGNGQSQPTAKLIGTVNHI